MSTNEAVLYTFNDIQWTSELRQPAVTMMNIISESFKHWVSLGKQVSLGTAGSSLYSEYGVVVLIVRLSWSKVPLYWDVDSDFELVTWF